MASNAVQLKKLRSQKTTLSRKIVKPHSWSTGDATCAGGIHFFMQRHRAVKY